MFQVTTDPVELWSAKDSRARTERDYFDSHFGYSMTFVFVMWNSKILLFVGKYKRLTFRALEKISKSILFNHEEKMILNDDQISKEQDEHQHSDSHLLVVFSIRG